MDNALSFQPDWASAPGKTISDVLFSKGVSIAEFSMAMKHSEVDVRKLLSGETSLSSEVAEALSSTIGGSISFWLKREQQYRDDLARLANSSPLPKAQDWLKSLPLAEMERFGWIKLGSTIEEKVSSALQFFGVDAFDEWLERFEGFVDQAAFRTSTTFETNIYSLMAWLRQGERVAEKYPSQNWDVERFEGALDDIRKLSKLKDPNIFIPKLRNLCADCGVSIAFVRAPKGCRASGATKFLPNGKPIIMLSFRYLTDDHFWFTFFHEAGHLILHADTPFHLEGIDVDGKEEEEANNFAALALIPAHLQPELLDLSTDKKSIMRFGVRAQISAGIVVGQLQHLGHLAPDQMNWLKKRYKWENIAAD